MRALNANAYFSSTLAPAFSSWALTFSASSLDTLSLTFFGAPSTRSLASLRPRPVSARTSLMTSIFFSPAPISTTVNSVFSSTGAAAAPPPGAAIATAAAAETPHLSSRSLASSAASSTVRLDSSFTSFDRSAIVFTSFRFELQRDWRRASCGFALAGIGLNHPRELCRRGGDDPRDLGGRGLDEADQPGTQFVKRRQRGERLDAVRIERGLAHRSAENDELGVRLGEVGRGLRCRHRIARIGDHGRPLEQGRDHGHFGAAKRDP